MVTASGASRPASLTQAQVDDLVRGQHEAAARALREHRPAELVARDEDTDTAGAKPVDLTAKDIDALRSGGAARKKLLARIAERLPPEAAPAPRGRATPGTSTPTVEPS